MWGKREPAESWGECMAEECGERVGRRRVRAPRGRVERINEVFNIRLLYVESGNGTAQQQMEKLL